MEGYEEEQEYLGLPGLLDAEQMRTLLQRRQAVQIEARAEAEREKKAAAAQEGTELHAVHERIASEELPALRKELNALVNMTSARTGRPHGAIHNDVRKNCGGPPTALCSAQQLKDRIAYLREW